MSFKKVLSLVLVLCMVLSFFPMSAFADAEDVVEEEVVEEVVTEEPVAEEPAPEPAAEEPAAEEAVVEEEVEEIETYSENAMDAGVTVASIGGMYDYTSLMGANGAIAEAGTEAVGMNTNISLVRDTTEAVVIAKTVTIAGGGNRIDGDVTITEGTVALSDVRITGNVTISGGTVTLENVTVNNNVKVSGGTVTISGSNVGNGVEVSGGTVALSETFVDGNVTVTDGALTIDGKKGEQQQYYGTVNGAATVTGGSLAITGGLFNGTLKATAPGTISVTGGSFAEDVKAYLAVGYDSAEVGGLYVVSPVDNWKVAMVETAAGRKYFPETEEGDGVAEAVAAADQKETVILLKKEKAGEYSYTFGKAETKLLVKLNGNELTVTYKYGEVTGTLKGVLDEATGITTYRAPVAFITSDGKTEYYNSFADAAEAAAKAGGLTVQFVAEELDAGDIYTMKATDKPFSAAVKETKITADVLKAKVLNPDKDAYKLEATNVDNTVKFELIPYVATITGADGKTTPYIEWNGAVERAEIDTRLVLNALVENKSVELDVVEGVGQAIAISKTGKAVSVTAKAGLDKQGYLLDTDETETAFVYRVVKVAATVTFYEMNDSYQYVAGKPKPFASFAEAAEFANGKNKADANAKAFITLAKDAEKETYTVGKNDATEALRIEKPEVLATTALPPTNLQILWLTIEPVAGKALKIEDKTEDWTIGGEAKKVSLTVASVTDAAVAVMDDTGKVDYYKDYNSEIVKSVEYAVGGEATKVVVLFADVKDAYTLTDGNAIDVIKGSSAFSVKPANASLGSKTRYAVTESDKTLFTRYESVLAVASVDKGDATVYYADFDDAVTAAAGTKVITLYPNMDKEQVVPRVLTYTLSAGQTLKVNLNGNNLKVVPGVEGKAVVVETEGNVNTYTLDTAVAYIQNKEEKTFYNKFADAAKDGRVENNSTTAPKTIVLMADVKDAYELQYGYQITVEKGSYKLPVKAQTVVGGDPHAIAEKTVGSAVNYKCVDAVASVKVDKDTTNYYASFAEGVAAVFVPADTVNDKALVVDVLSKPTSTDVYSAVPGYFLVKTTDGLTIGDVMANVKTETGVVADYVEVENQENIYLVVIAPAAASITSNTGKTNYYFSVEDAVAGPFTSTNPIVILQDGLSYAMPKGTKTLYVEKNGHTDFAVTTTNPGGIGKDAAPGENDRYLIVESPLGTLAAYATADGVAYIDTVEMIDNPAGYGKIEKHSWVFYKTFADAVAASENGEKVIILVKDNLSYTMSDTEQMIKVKKNAYTETLTVKPAEGLAVNARTGSDGVTVYTVSVRVASVTAKFGRDPEPSTNDNYGEGMLAQAVYDALNNREGVITLYANPGEDFVYTLTLDDTLTVAKNGSYMFTEDNFEVPEEYHATITNVEGKDQVQIKARKLFVTVADGEVTHYFDTFGAAVDEVVKLESYDVHGDVQNPTTPITLWRDMKEEEVFFMGAYPPVSDKPVQSLYVNAQGYETKIRVDSTLLGKKFVKVTEGTGGAPNLYALTDTYAMVTLSSGTGKPVVTPFETFAAAAADAFNNEQKTVTITQAPKATDVFKMAGGTLKVKIAEEVDLTCQKLIDNKNIVKDGGKDVALTCDKPTEKAGTFTVAGTEASIYYAKTGTTTNYTTVEEAIVAAKNEANLVVTPLMSLDRELSFATGKAPVNGDYFMLADSEYDVNLTLGGFELVAEQSGDAWKVTFKTAVASVETDEIIGYDDYNNPIYAEKQFADFGEAVVFADGTKVVTYLPTTLDSKFDYAMTSGEEFWWAPIKGSSVTAETFGAKLTENVKSAGLFVTAEDGEDEYKGATKFTCGNPIITLNSGDSAAKTVDGKTFYEVRDFAVGDWIDLDPYSTVFTKVDGDKHYVPTGWTYTGEGTEPESMPNANISYKVTSWKPVAAVTLNWANDNNVMRTTTQYPGEVLKVVGLKQLPSVPTKEGYRLDEDNLWTPEVPELVPAQSQIFNLNWIEQEKVSFFYDGKVQAEIFVDKDSKLSENPDVPAPTTAEKEIKWTLDGADYDMSKPVTGDLTLIGEWVPKTFTVTFMNGEDIYDEVPVEYGQKVAKPEDPTATVVGVKFGAWYEQGVTTAFDFDTAIIKDTVLEAVWEPLTAEVTVDPALEVHQTIGIKFYVQPSEWADPSNITVNVAYTSKYQTVNNTYTLSDLTPINGEYEIKAIDAASDEMSDTVTLTIKEGDKEIFKQDYTIATIANEWLADDGMQQYWPLLKAMLQYGDKAQGFFNNHPDQHITPAGAPALIPIPATYAPGEDPTTLADYIEYCQFSISLETAVQMSFYVKPKDGYGMDDITVTVTDKDGKVVTGIKAEQVGSEIKYTLPGLYPEQLLNDYNVTITVDGVSATYVRSVMSCAYGLEQRGLAVELLEALYQYSLAAQGIWG